MLQLHLTPKVFMGHHVNDGGHLPMEPAADACWYYCGLAMKSLEKFDEGRVFEDDKDIPTQLETIAWGISKLYDLENPGEFLKFLRYCKKEARHCGLPWDDRIEDPKTTKHRIKALRESII